MICVRLSEDEYVALRELCSMTGARSVSDLTRDAMRAFLNGSREDTINLRMNDICAHVDNWGRRVEELFEKVSQTMKQSEQ